MVHRCHGMRRSRFSCDSAAAAASSTVRFRPWGALTASQVPQHVPLPPPTTLRPSAAMLAAQRARSCMAPLSPCPWARPQPPMRHSQACCSAPGRALCAATTAVPSCTTAELSVRLGTALAAAGGGVEAQRGPAVARRPPRGFAAQVHQLALAWRPGKGTGDAPFLGGDPRAICGHPGQARAAHSTCMLAFSAAPDLLSQAQSEPLRSRLDPLDRMKGFVHTRRRIAGKSATKA